MNSVILIGRMTNDPELKYGQNGTAICKFTLAVARRKKEEADFIRCVSFGKTAELIAEYHNKGSQIAIQGRIQVNPYEDKDGNKRTSTDVIVDLMDFVGSKKNADKAEKAETSIEEDWNALGREINPEDIPF
jgi:single-strand DNA-binding protein